MTNKFIYLRFSKEEENTELKIRYERDLNSILETFLIKDDNYKVFLEKEAISAYNTDKFDKREAFIEMNDILFNSIDNWKKIFIDDTKKDFTLYVKSFDRISRNIFHLTQFLLLCIERKIKVYSVNEPHINKFIKDFIEKENIDTREKFMTIMNFCLLGFGAEDYSNQISIKTKKAFQKNNKGQTISYKGNLTGRRKDNIPKKVIQRIKEYRKNNFSYISISEMKDVYKLKNNQKEKISHTTIKQLLED